MPQFVEAFVDGKQWFVRFRKTARGTVIWEGWVLDEKDPVFKAVAAAYKLMEDDQ